MGKLFWYIFQANLPEGLIDKNDFLINDDEIFVIISNMLQYNKDRRPELTAVQTQFEPIRKRLVA